MRQGIAVAIGAAIAASAAFASATPVGPLPKGPVTPVIARPGGSFTVTLPKSSAPGRVWRVARAFDSTVVRELSEGETAQSVWLTFRAVAPGRTNVVFASTRGETAHAYAAHTYRVNVVSTCPANLLPLDGTNPIAPAIAAALAADPVKNRPQVTGATLASSDTQRGPQVERACGANVAARTVIVSITDRALLPSASLSERIDFVGRTKSGYVVWQHAH